MTDSSKKTSENKLRKGWKDAGCVPCQESCLLSLQLVVHSANELFPEILLGISTSWDVNTSRSAEAHAGDVPFSRWLRWSLCSSCRIFLQPLVHQFPNSSQLSQPGLVILEVTALCHSLSGTGDTVNVGLLLGCHKALAQALGTEQERAFRRGFLRKNVL